MNVFTIAVEKRPEDPRVGIKYLSPPNMHLRHHPYSALLGPLLGQCGYSHSGLSVTPVSGVPGRRGTLMPPFLSAPASDICNSNFLISDRLEPSLSYSSPRFMQSLSNWVSPSCFSLARAHARFCQSEPGSVCSPALYQNRQSFLVYQHH